MRPTGAFFTRVQAAVGVVVGDVMHTGKQREEAITLHDLAGGQRERAERAPVKRAEKGDHVLATRVPARHFERRFDGFRAGICQKHAGVAAERRDFRQPLRQPNLHFVVIIRPGDVDELLRLLGDRPNDFRVAVPG